MLVPGVVKRSWAWFLGLGLAVLASGCGATLNPTPGTGGTSGAAGNGNGGLAGNGSGGAAGNGGAAGSPAGDASADSGCGPDTDLMSDPDNCGSCGFRCCNGSCVQGYCFCDGPPGITCCSTDERGADGCYFQSVAVNILINPMNCGTCGNVCGADQTCSTGACVDTTTGTAGAGGTTGSGGASGGTAGTSGGSGGATAGSSGGTAGNVCGGVTCLAGEYFDVPMCRCVADPVLDGAVHP
jgi:hypothetical protein